VDFSALLLEKREDRFSRVLALLLEIEEYRTRFLRAVVTSAARVDAAWRIRFQASIPGGVADLLLESRSDVLVVEAKIDAGFGPGQLTNYARYLNSQTARSKSRCGYLVLLVPRARAFILEEVARKLLRVERLRTTVITITWEDTADFARSVHGARSLNVESKATLRAYADLIEGYLGSSSRPLTEAEALVVAGPEAPRALMEALQLVDPITAKLHSVLGRALRIGSKTYGYFYAGRDLSFRGRAFWFGCWIDLWHKLGVTPLWLQMYGRKPHLAEGIATELGVREGENGLVCPMPLQAHLNRDALVETSVEKCLRFIRLEEPAG
jgi:hypothetical protein